MPPPSCANNATRLAPNPKPTIDRIRLASVALAGHRGMVYPAVMQSLNVVGVMADPKAPYPEYKRATPARDMLTIERPQNAPPRSAMARASMKDLREPAAERTFERIAICIPM